MNLNLPPILAGMASVPAILGKRQTWPLGDTPPRTASDNVPTARDGKGNTLYLRGGKWVNAQGQAVQ